MKTGVVVSSSGGKDSILTLDRVRRDGRYNVTALITTVDDASRRVTAHGIPVELVAAQADAVDVPLITVELPANPSNSVYLERLERVLAQMRGAGTTAVAFGDIFLEDLREWRERSLSAMGLRAIFPLWHAASRELSNEFVSRGFCAVICCVNGSFLDRTYLGRLYDIRLLETLPAGIDPCGENGEFHTFVFDGPVFRRPIRYVIGEVTNKPTMRGSPVRGHWFCDIVPSETRPERCPLCGAHNNCGMAGGQASCWCFFERIPRKIYERIPPYARDLACVCQSCATETPSV
jgi:uncharacterized protein (TIGR00290 family)